MGESDPNNQWLWQRAGAALQPIETWWGPHSTNHAKWYHSGLSSLFKTWSWRRLQLGLCLGKMQQLDNEIRQRVKQLERGGGIHGTTETFRWWKIPSGPDWLDTACKDMPNLRTNTFTSFGMEEQFYCLANSFTFSLTKIVLFWCLMSCNKLLLQTCLLYIAYSLAHSAATPDTFFLHFRTKLVKSKAG